MAKVALTDKQKMDRELDAVCLGIIKTIRGVFNGDKFMNEKETAKAIGVNPDTWCSWQKKNIAPGVDFRKVAAALYKAGYTITLEPRKGK